MISIVVPNYNKVKCIEDALCSIISQTYLSWEAIVVDDGSTDGSQDVIKEVASSDSRIKYIERKDGNKGGSACRNIGITAAKGEYLMFFDSDDLMIPECLQQRVEYMIKNPALDFSIFPVGTFYHAIGDSSMVWQPSKNKHLSAFLRHDLPWNIMSPIWKTSYVRDKLQGFDERFPRLQDVEFHTKALLNNDVLYAVNRNVPPCCFYRIDQNRTTISSLSKLQIMHQGVDLYLDKFYPILLNNVLLNDLRGTLFSFLIQANYYKCQKMINECEYNCIIDLSILKITSLYSDKYGRIISLYCYLYQHGLWRLKGFNYFFKYMFVKCL